MIFDICLLCLSKSLFSLQLLLVLILPLCLFLPALVLTKTCLRIIVLLLSPCRIFLSRLGCPPPHLIIIVVVTAAGFWRWGGCRRDMLSWGCRYILIIGWTSPKTWFAIEDQDYAEIEIDSLVFVVLHGHVVDKSPCYDFFVSCLVNVNVSDINEWWSPLSLISLIKCL